MDARQSDMGVGLGVMSPPVMDRADTALRNEPLVEAWVGDPGAGAERTRSTAKWPAVAILGGVALSALWVGLLAWLLGRWMGAV